MRTRFPLGLGTEKFVADDIILLNLSAERGYLEQRLRVTKMRWTEARKEELSYDIGEHGLPKQR